METIKKLSAKKYDFFDKYIFLCEMYDDAEKNIKVLLLRFYPFDNSIEVIDANKGKRLVRRVQCPNVIPEKLQIGNTINVFSRLLKIKDATTQDGTKSQFFHKERTFILIKPIDRSLHGKVLTFIVKHGFTIIKMKNCLLSIDDAKKLYARVSGSPMMPFVVDYIVSGEVIGLEVVCPNAIRRWKKLLGPTDPKDAAPWTLRGKYGTDVLRNVAHGCVDKKETEANLNYFFGSDERGIPIVALRATFTNCTCCIIKPHVLIDGHLGNIFEEINKDFYISSMAMFAVNLCDAREFYEIYKGVLPEYEDMAMHLAEGSCIVLEVKCKDPSLNPVCEFRKLCGHRDPNTLNAALLSVLYIMVPPLDIADATSEILFAKA